MTLEIEGKWCPFCEGGGVDGDDACSGCGGSGAWLDALVRIAGELADWMDESGYGDVAPRRDLAVLLPQRASVGEKGTG
jgi:hypothetical protein